MLMRLSLFVAWLVIPVAVGGCGLAGKTISAHDDSLSYKFTVNECSTGSHRLSSIEELCRTLVDETKNNRCAKEERLKMFRDKNCARFVDTDQTVDDKGDRSRPNASLVELDDAAKKLIGKKLATSKPAYVTGGEYVAIALTLNADGTYEALLARGLTESVKPENGTKISSAWAGKGITFTLAGLGTAKAGMFNGRPGVSLTITAKELFGGERGFFLN